MRKVAVIFILIVLFSILGLYFLKNQATEPVFSPQSNTTSDSEKNAFVDFTATFEIVTNGSTRTFTQSMYHNQSDKVFIEPSNPNTVLVKKEGVTWNDFFSTLPFSLSKDCLTTGTGQTFCTNDAQRLTFFLNGNDTPEALELEINPNDNLEVIY